MLTKAIMIAACAAALAVPAHAAGDVAKGEKEFNKCKTCHMIVAADGTEIVKGNKVGPNLYGVIGRPVASYPEFKYGDGILAAGAAGLVWDEAMLAEYVKDPKKWLAANSGDPKAKTLMTFKLAKGGEDVAAYLASVAPPPADAAAEPAPASN
ncbi:MAG: c-type cytochrome [Gemmobacter sp.]